MNEKKEQQYDVAILESELAIVSRMDNLVDEVRKEIEDMKLDELAATEDNKKIITDMRVKLNSKINVYDSEITAISKKVNEPIDLLRSQYKLKLKPEIEKEIEKLKNKLEKITEAQLQENIDYSHEYYGSKAKTVDLRIGTKYEDIPWSFRFNSSKKSIRDTVDAHFKSVEDSLLIIDSHEFSARLEELWIENKYNLNEAQIILQKEINMAKQIMEERERQLKAEEERLRLKEEELKKAEEEIKIEEPEVIKPAMPKLEKIDNYLFEIEMTDSELADFINYLEGRGITYNLKK